MSLHAQYRAYVGTTTGALAYTHCNTEDVSDCKLEDVLHYELNDVEKSEVTVLEWDKSETEIIVGYKNGLVKYYDTVNSKFTKKINNLKGNGASVGVCEVDDNLIVGRKNGIINIWSKTDLNTFSINLPNDGSMDCCAQNKVNGKLVGTGGENNDFKLWDVESKTNIFKAKSLGHDELNLPIPTTLSGICFFENEEHLASCSSREGHVLLYDKRAQRRPVTKFFTTKASYTTIASAHRERHCVVGTNKGYIQLIDLRAPTKVVKTFKSFVGGITSLVCDPASSIVVGTSLDRYLRVHNLNTSKCIFKKYMQQSLNQVLIKPIVKIEPKAEEDEEYESLFNNMETVVEDRPTKKRRIEKNEEELLDLSNSVPTVKSIIKEVKMKKKKEKLKSK